MFVFVWGGGQIDPPPADFKHPQTLPVIGLMERGEGDIFWGEGDTYDIVYTPEIFARLVA